MVYKPLDLLFEHLLLRNEHVFKNFNQFCLKGGVRDSLSHLHDLDNRFLKQERPTRSKRKAIKINRQALYLCYNLTGMSESEQTLKVTLQNSSRRGEYITTEKFQIQTTPDWFDWTKKNARKG